MLEQLKLVTVLIALISVVVVAQPDDFGDYANIVNSTGVTVSIETKLRTFLEATCPIAFYSDRPILGDQDMPVVAQVNLQPMKFIGIDDTEQQFSLIANVWLSWSLPDCANWQDNARFNKTPFIIANDRNSKIPIWHPRVWLANSATDHLFVTDYDPTQQMYYLNNNGIMSIYPLGLFTAACDLGEGLYRFPFDTQTCHLGIEDYDDTRFAIIIDQGIVTPDPVTWSNFVNQAEVWELVNNYSISKWTSIGGSPSAHIDYHFTFKRKPASYVFSMILPSICLIALQLANFLIPPKHPERVIFSVTLLLALYVLFGEVNNHIPQISTPVLMMIYGGIQFAINSVLTIYFLLSSELALQKNWNRTTDFNQYLGFCNGVPFHLTLVRCCDLVVAVISTIIVVIEHGVIFGLMLSPAETYLYQSALLNANDSTGPCFLQPPGANGLVVPITPNC